MMCYLPFHFARPHVLHSSPASPTAAAFKTPIQTDETCAACICTRARNKYYLRQIKYRRDVTIAIISG